MSDFKVHPVLTSPAMGAVVSGLIAMGVVDTGIADLLQAAGGETTIDAHTWSTIVEMHWSVMVISAFLGCVAWFMLFRTGANITVPAAGIVLGIAGTVLSVALIWVLHHSIDLP